MKRTLLITFALSLFVISTSFAQFVNPTGSLNVLRASHQSQLLQNGQVLAFGGQNNGVLQSAELYNPSTGTWTQTNDMMQARTQFASVILDDGRVMAIGGSDGTAETSTCELYDPATGTWSFTGSLSVNTSFPAAVKLLDGRVMMTYVTTCEIYHPDSAQWYPAASPSEFRSDLVLLDDGKVLSVGISTSGEVYDPGTDTWSPVSNTLTGSVTSADGLSKLPDGRVVIVGGSSGSVDMYDPATNSFGSAQSMLIGIPLLSSVAANNGNVLVFGPSSAADGNNTQTIQVYNGPDDQWYTDTYAFYGPSRSRLHTLPSGSILSVGGSARFGGLDPDCYLISSRVVAVSNEEELSQSSVSVFPNPAHDLFQIESTTSFTGQFQLLDLQGKLVWESPIHELSTQLEIGHLPRGIFLYQILGEEGLVSRGKVILE